MAVIGCVVCVQARPVTVTLPFADAPAASTITPRDLRVEYMPSPMGVDTETPRFFWKVVASNGGRGLVQTAYQIVVAEKKTTGDVQVWDSDKVKSSETIQIKYAGKALSQRTTYTWTVTVWDGADAVSQTAVSTFETGFFGDGFLVDSKWIQADDADKNVMRKEFKIAALPAGAKARLYVTSVGFNEVYINGAKAGNNVLEPGWTTLERRTLYSVHDVTGDLREGTNAIGVMTGHGHEWQGGTVPWVPTGVMRAVNLQVRIITDDSDTVAVATDDSWVAAYGPIRSNSLYDGEEYDATIAQEFAGWMMPNYTPAASTTWTAVKVSSPAPTPTVSAQMMPAIQRMEWFPAQTIHSPQPGVYVIDFGQNLSGWCYLSIPGGLVPRGTKITIRHAEVLMHPPYGPRDGNIYVGNLRSAKATDTYTATGDLDGETYEPRFTVHGFRYAEISGLPFAPTLETLHAIHVRSSVEQTGSLQFSLNILNKIQRAVTWGTQTNLMSVPTDCDQRDERKGWMGDANLTAGEAVFNFDLAAFYTNFLRDIVDTQKGPSDPDAGSIPDTVPHTFGSYPADPSWGSAFPTIAHLMLEQYGDVQLVGDMYDSLKAYMTFVKGKIDSTGIANMYTSYGDWVPPPPASKAPNPLVSAAAYFQDLKHMSKMATALGKYEDAAMFYHVHAKYVQDFNNAFYKAASKSYGADGLQSSIALALVADAVAEANTAGVLETLVNDVVVTNKMHLSTGILGTKALLESLSQHGRGDIALQIASQTTYPSWGFMMEHPDEPATTLWELWDGPSEGPGMNSRNHHMFGTVGNWFYNSLVGFAQRNDSLAFEHIVFAPDAHAIYQGSLSYATGSYKSVRGFMGLTWNTNDAVKTCDLVDEHAAVSLSCGASVISDVTFASFGTPSGSCPSLTTGTCNSAKSMDVVKAACLGKSSCTVDAEIQTFDGVDPCYGTKKQLAVAVTCKQRPTLVMNVIVPPNTVADVVVPLPAGVSADSVTIVCGSTVVFEHGAFKPNTESVTDAVTTDGAVFVSVLSGHYDLSLLHN
eukprot:GFYU01008705.1.p1 GENE.GFYU01008705.1~~GFYU01008705.1.p1  ORF type:complete len:1064 (-),score=338.26 GFYU01008705.1:1031-4144(-)